MVMVLLGARIWWWCRRDQEVDGDDGSKKGDGDDEEGSKKWGWVQIDMGWGRYCCFQNEFVMLFAGACWGASIWVEFVRKTKYLCDGPIDVTAVGFFFGVT